MEHTVSIVLLHPSVNEVAGVAQLSYFLCQKLHSKRRVAEYDCLIYIKSGEEGVKAVYLLSLFDEGVVLGDPFQCQLVHQVDLMRIRQKFLLKGYHSSGIRC